MRVALLSAALFAGTVLAGTARADVGPRAPCGAGTHHQYLYGHHCVTNGFHLERGPDGHVEEVQDGKELARPPTPPPTPVPPSTATAAPTFAMPPAPTAPPPPTPVEPPAPSPPPEPPSARGCGCDLAASSPGIALGSIALGVGLLGLSRRRRRSR